MLHDIFVSGLRSSKLFSTLITECEEKSFYDSVERAKTLEEVLQDTEDINPSVKVHSQNTVDMNKVQNKDNATVKIPKKFLKNYMSIRCGTRIVHFGNECFAIKLKCNLFSSTGQLAKVCKSKSKPA